MFQRYVKVLRPVSPVHLMRVSKKVARSMKQTRSVRRKLDARDLEVSESSNLSQRLTIKKKKFRNTLKIL